MLSKEQRAIIEKYVDKKCFYQDKLIKYLNMHDIVGNEIFEYVDRRDKNLYGGGAHLMVLDSEIGYEPVDVKTFVRRIPFYFYVGDEAPTSYNGTLGNVIVSSWDRIKEDQITLEIVYEDLEFLFYKKQIPLYKIFNYSIEQNGLSDETFFFDWLDYIKLCEVLGWSDIMPENFIVAYNRAREAGGKEPIIYTPIWDMHMEKPYKRNGKVLEFEGVFPCDERGRAIMEWIGLKIINPGRITCFSEKAYCGNLTVEINPETVIYYRDEDEERVPYWKQVYAGPLTMNFDSHVLKYRREALGYTQQDVADAVGANIRTYQKWEYGTTQPDGHYLLRLMNWLDISDVQDATAYDIPE